MVRSATICLLAVLAHGVGTAHAQTVGGYSAPSSGGISAASAVTNSQSGWPPRTWPPTLGQAANAVGAERSNTQRRATEGTGEINATNADAVARTGDVGAATRIGANPTSSGSAANDRPVSISGTGPEELFNIPRPRVNVDLDGIRRAIRAGPNASPDRRGN